MELIDVEPVRVKKITDEQRASLCRCSTMEPHVYHQSIEAIRRDPKQQCAEQDPFIKAWNLNVDVNMIRLPARVLPMPEIVYTAEYRVGSQGVQNLGTWKLKPTTRYYKPASFPDVWGIINLSFLDRNSCEDFATELRNVAEQRGMRCPVPVIYEEWTVERYNIHEIMDMLRDTIKRNDDCYFFFVILPEKNPAANKNVYRSLKREVDYLLIQVG